MNINEKYIKIKRPIKILQFGEGNFLRCFIDWMIQKINDNKNMTFSSNIAIVQPLEKGMIDKLKEQNGLYTVILQGIEDGKIIDTNEVINVVDDYINPYTDYQAYLSYATTEDLEFIISNTTEAGIVLNPNDLDLTKTPISYPGKLLAFLLRRYEYFHGDEKMGLDIIPCELIDNNGDTLKEVLHELALINHLDDKFIKWLLEANRFYNTLVDRIVPGYPRNQEQELWEKLGYVDHLMVKGEPFHLWVIEDHYQLNKRLPLDKILNVKFVNDVTPYKVRKVKILNGSHTLMTPLSYLAGYDTVGETMNDKVLASFVKGFIFDEVIPTINLPAKDMINFANSVLERYQNPFVRHELMSISLNSLTKYKTRILNTVIDSFSEYHFPANALYSLACLIVFYRGKRESELINLVDNEEYLVFFKQIWDEFIMTDEGIHKLVNKVLSWKEHWGIDLTSIDLVSEFIEEAIKEILTKGVINDFFKQNCHFR